MTRTTRDQPRNPKGKFIKTAESYERDAEALRLRSRGMSLREIGQRLGYGDESNTCRALSRAVDAVRGEPAREVIQQQVELLNLMTEKAMAVLERHHIKVDHGRVILLGRPPEEGGDDEREPLLDDGPILQAISTLLRIQERRARLLGLDAPARVDATVHEVTQVDLQVQELIREAKARQAVEVEQMRGER